MIEIVSGVAQVQYTFKGEVVILTEGISESRGHRLDGRPFPDGVLR